MSTLFPFLIIESPCEQALHSVRQRLAQAGMRCVQTFDLHAARAGSHDCSCPNHGTNECDCQLVVVLVYGDAGEPATLVLHGNDGKTWISLESSPPSTPRETLAINIRQVLEANS